MLQISGTTHTFTLSHRTIETTKTYTYLGLKITSTGNFTLAVKELKEKAQRAFYAIKRSIKIVIPKSKEKHQTMDAGQN